MYLRAKYTKYKMAKTKFSIWRYVICDICLQGGRFNLHLIIGGHHCQQDNQCRDPMKNKKDCRVGQLTIKPGDHSFFPLGETFAAGWRSSGPQFQIQPTVGPRPEHTGRRKVPQHTKSGSKVLLHKPYQRLIETDG